MACSFQELTVRFELAGHQFQIINLLDGVIQQVIPSHHHGRTSYEIHYIASGYGAVLISGQKHALGPGSLYMTGPGVDHAQLPAATQPMRELCVYLKTADQPTAHMATPPPQTMAANLEEFLTTTCWIGRDQQGLDRLFKEIFQEMAQQQSGFQITLSALFQQLIVKMLRNYQGRPRLEHPQARLVPADQIALTIESYFLYDYQQASLTDLARQIDSSPRQTERWLQRLYGQTFREKKAEARMSAAAMLLNESATSISTIGAAVGFTSLEHFSHAFKNYYGQSPRAFRQGASMPPSGAGHCKTALSNHR
ncbi:AraC family transcriptional regulator [Lapidilactobacillus salsurivasis]